MKLFFGAICLSLCSTMTFANKDITGLWYYMDDKTGEAKGVVEIKKQNNNTYAGNVVKITPRPGYVAKEICTKCLPPNTNKPILGLEVISSLTTSDQVNYTNGQIIDPVSGKNYRLTAKMNSDKNKLHLRGFIGVSAIGRSQTWLRVK